MKRYKSAALCMALVMSLTACGHETAGNENSGTGATAAATAETQMGRWIESELDLGGREIAGGPALMEDGSLVIFVYTQDSATGETGALTRLTSDDNGETWTEDNPGWSDAVEGFISHVWVAPDGAACLGAVTLGEENTYQLYVQMPGQELKAIPLDQTNAVQHAVFFQENLLLFQQYYDPAAIHNEMISYNPETEETQTFSMDEAASIGGGVAPTVAGDKLLYLYYGESSMPLMELNPKDGTSTQLLDDLSDAISTGALTGDEEGALYYAASSGIYRLAPGGTLPEQLMAADGTSLSVKSNYPVSLCRAGNGDFLVTAMNDNALYKVYRYHFDESLSTKAETTLQVWALQDSSTARAAINVYKQQHPEVDVTFTVAIPEDAQDQATARNDALTQLNTELLAGEGPDVLLLDGVAYETYAKKGLLADLHDVLPLDALQKNLTQPFIEDGKVFVMPARFSIPVLIGDAGTMDTLTSLAAMEQAVLDAAPRPNFGETSSDSDAELAEDQKYALRLTSAEEFADFLLPVTAQAILKRESLDEEALRQVMTFVQSVADYYNIKDYTKDIPTGSAQSWTGTDVIAIDSSQGEYSDLGYAKYGWFNMQTPFSVLAMARREDAMDYNSSKVPCEIMLRPGLTEGVYTPGTLVGVNAGSAQQEAAKQLAAAFFDTSVQGNYYSDGMTVRADCLSDKLDSVIHNDMYPADIFQGNLQDLLDSCTTPVVVPALLRDSFVQHADAIIQGQETAEDAVKGIKSDIGLYLAEQQ